MFLLLCKNDWANRAYKTVRALRSVGIDAQGAKLIPHKYKFPRQLPVLGMKKIQRAVDVSEIVWFTHSNYRLLLRLNLSGKTVIMSHSGTKYRQNYKGINKTVNPYVDLTITCEASLMGLGAKNERFVSLKIADGFSPVYHSGDPLTIAHYPSAAHTKGTRTIRRVLEDYPHNISSKPVSWKKNIKRMSKCDIYIDQLKLRQKGRPLGEFGQATVEAAMLGKIVIVNYLYPERYIDEYGHFAPRIANNTKELKEHLEELFDKEQDEIVEEQLQSRAWALRNHSYQAVGEKLKSVFREVSLL